MPLESPASSPPVPRPSGRSAEKRAAVLRGARRVFGRDGYSRATIAEIAREAGVSTRTIYHHAADKAQLFAAALEQSASEVADAQIAIVERFLGDPDAADLHAFGRAFARPDPRWTDHFALVRQIRADVAHVPEVAREAWQDAGPRRVRRELARVLGRLAERGRLRAGDSDLAAVHLVALAAGEVAERTFQGALPLDDDEIDRTADAGVDAFLRAYGPTA